MNKLPDNWELKTLSEVGDIIGGGTPNTTKEEYWNGDILWVIPSEVTSLPTKYLYTTERKITELGLKNSSAKIIKPNSLIICTRATIGDCCINRNEVSTNQGFKSIIPNENYDVVFLYYLISNSKQKLISKASGTTFLEISKSNLANLTFNFPPLEEQKRIASALSKVDAYLENTIKLTESKERFKRAITKKLLTCKENKNVPEARFEGFEDEWKEHNLSKIGISYGGLKNKKAKSFLENCNAKYITYKSIYDKSKIDIDRLENVFVDKNENQNLVKYGDAFFTISSETPNELAMSSILLDEVENTYLNSFCFGFRFDFSILLPKFARYYFRSDYIRKSTYKLAQGSTRYNISKNKFLDIIIYLPSLEEQEKIGEFLSLLDAEIDNLKKQAESIKRLKKGLMKKLMSGEIRV